MTDQTDPRPGPDPEIADELLGAYALDALDDDERRLVEHRLATNPAAQAEVDRMTRAIDEVVDAQVDLEAGHEIDSPRPPADLWARIAEQLPPRPERVPTGVESVPPATSVPSLTGQDSGMAGPADELAVRRQRRLSGPARVAVAVAAAVIVIAAGVGIVRSQTKTTTTTVAAQLEQQADRVAAEPGSHSATLTGALPDMSVRVVIDSEGRGFVVPTGMPALDTDQTYQLWSVEDGTPISLGLLGSDPTVTIVGTGTTPSQLAVTTEPAGGSTSPTSNPVAVGTVV